MNAENKVLLNEALVLLSTKVSNLNNRINDALGNGESYAFVLCKAKVSFIQSLIDDVNAALAGQVPEVVVASTLEAVKHVEENFQPFLGTCGSECSYKLVQISPEKSIEISRRMAESMKKGTDEPFTEA